MSNMQMLFLDPAVGRAAHSLPRPADAKMPFGVAGSVAVPPRDGADRELRALLAQQVSETEELQGLLCSLNLPILHLSSDLRLRRFSQAAAQLFGLASDDLGGLLDLRWPTAPKLAMAEVCRTGTACGCGAQGPGGKEVQCQLLPHSARHGVPASVIVILLLPSETNPVDQPPPQEKSDLTPRQWQVMNLVLAGHPSKNIAADLKISRRTVENHRAAIMQRTGATSLPALARIAVGAAGHADHRLPHSLPSLPDFHV